MEANDSGSTSTTALQKALGVLYASKVPWWTAHGIAALAIAMYVFSYMMSIPRSAAAVKERICNGTKNPCNDMGVLERLAQDPITLLVLLVFLFFMAISVVVATAYWDDKRYRLGQIIIYVAILGFMAFLCYKADHDMQGRDPKNRWWSGATGVGSLSAVLAGLMIPITIYGYVA
jgi:hypothetical protein